MKKSYIAPNLTVIKVELQGMIADSPSGEASKEKNLWELDETEKGSVETDANLPITAKRYDAWSSWDE